MVFLSPSRELAFDQGDPIGSGATSQVHRATRKSDPTQEFAVKSVKREDILSDP